ncbi:MAG: Type 1 glutamine amidotransferase-like domain-containing protein [bacterium]
MSQILLYSDFRPGLSRLMDDELLRLLAGTSCRVGYIPSESDLKRRYFDKICERYEDIGITDVIYFDLGQEFSKENIPDLMSCDVIHLSGGDPEKFLNLVRQRSFTEHLKTFLKKGGFLAGISAGAMILTPSLGLLDVDSKKNPTAKPRPALSMVNFEFYPHFKEDDVTKRALASYARARQTRVYACDDDGGLVVHQGQVTTIGRVTCFEPF